MTACEDPVRAAPPGTPGVPSDTEAIAGALRRGFGYLASVQRPEGCVVGEVVWCPPNT